MKLLTTISSILLISSLSSAEPKSYQYFFGAKLDQLDCLNEAIQVAARYKLAIQPEDLNGNRSLNDTNGNRAGMVYVSEDTCHIYVF